MNDLRTNTILMHYISDEGYHSVDDILAIIECMIVNGCHNLTWTPDDLQIAINDFRLVAWPTV